MDVSRIRALRGPNLWSRQTAIEAVVAVQQVQGAYLEPDAARQAAALWQPLAPTPAGQPSLAGLSRYCRQVAQQFNLQGRSLVNNGGELLSQQGMLLNLTGAFDNTSGKVSSVKVVSSQLASPELEKKLVARLKSLNFGSRDLARTTTKWAVAFLPQ